jgi:DUF1365 family protein
MIDTANDKKLFDASLMLKRRPISHKELTSVLMKYPFMTMKVTSMIYFQALRLLLKNTPFFTHPKKKIASRQRK